MDYIKYFSRKYPHIQEEDIIIYEEGAKEVLLHLLFKSSTQIALRQKLWAFESYKMWIARCMQEFIERDGNTSALHYSENGLSITFDSTQLSSTLINEIVPLAVFR